MNLPVKVLTKVGGGGGGARVGVNTRVIVEYEQKGDQAKSTALEIYFFSILSKSNTRNFNLDFYSTNFVSCPGHG